MNTNPSVSNFQILNMDGSKSLNDQVEDSFLFTLFIKWNNSTHKYLAIEESLIKINQWLLMISWLIISIIHW